MTIIKNTKKHVKDIFEEEKVKKGKKAPKRYQNLTEEEKEKSVITTFLRNKSKRKLVKYKKKLFKA